MIKAVVETPARLSAGHEVTVRVMDLMRTITPDRDLVCPRCGHMQFTARVSEAGDLVLSCWYEPTHMRVRLHHD